MASGSGCKSPAGRRRGGDDWSAGRSAASRDGRRALIARSQDLPRAPLPRAASTRQGEWTGVYGPGSRPIHPANRARRVDAALYLLPPDPAGPHTWRGSVPRRDIDQVAEPFRERRRSPAVLPTSPLRTASPTPVRSARVGVSACRQPSAPKERSPPACVGRRSMDGDARAMSPVWTRSGSRPNKSWLLGS